MRRTRGDTRVEKRGEDRGRDREEVRRGEERGVKRGVEGLEGGERGIRLISGRSFREASLQRRP
jgi:hypothetical protein